MSCYNSVVLNAPADTVWAALSNFHDLSWTPNVVSKVDVVGEVGAREVGARRILNDAFHETLVSVDNEARVFTYAITDGPGPLEAGQVSNYLGRVEVMSVTVADGDQCVVLWTASWGDENGGVGEFVDPIYKALLGDMRGTFG